MIQLTPQQLRMIKLKRADPISYNKIICNKILEKTSNMRLPNLDRNTLERLKKHLTDYHIVKTDEPNQRFLNLRNAFLIIDQLEESQKDKETIKPILDYLQEFEPIFQQIRDEKTPKHIIEHSTKILNFQITLFNIKYNILLTDIETTTLDTTNITINEENNKEET